jgi:chromosome segregation ATPase
MAAGDALDADTLAGEHEEELGAVQDAVKNLRDIFADARKLLGIQEAGMAELRLLVKTADKGRTEAEGRFRKAMADLDACNAELSKVRSELESTRSEKEMALMSMEKAEERAGRAERELQDSLADKESKVDEIAALQAELRAITDENAEFKRVSRVVSLQNENGKLREEVASLQSENDKLRRGGSSSRSRASSNLKEA